ncbi:MAG TPA: sulfite exporter TauE/SafE family protein [Candidatus Limnocylindria bacterium]|nr:sulfite exporter TauE/SafE family protein [Candidatus Limnocylindria bacterium]
MNYALALLIGLVGGISSGLFGVGGGVVMVPAMLFFAMLGVRDTQQAVGTSLIVIIPTAIIGALRHKTLGNINWPIAWMLIPGAIIGGWLGASLTKEISSENLKRMFGAFIIVVGCRLLFWK